MLTAYDFLLVAIGLERLLELKIARFNHRVALLRGAIEVAPKQFFWMRLLHAALLLGCLLEPRFFGTHGTSPWSYVWLIFLLLAQMLRYSCIWALGPAWNVRILVVPGERAQTRGPYRWLRHPNYVAVVMDGLALPMVGGCWRTAIAFFCLNGLLLFFRIQAEQRALFAYLKEYSQVGRV